MQLSSLPLALLLSFVLIFMQGCSSSAGRFATNDIDPSGGLSREDYLALRQRGEQDATETQTPPPIPAMPEETDDAGMETVPLDKRVSINVTDKA